MIREYILNLFKTKGFVNSRIAGCHPGHTVSVGGVMLEIEHQEYVNFELGDIGYTDNKIAQLVRGYLEKESFTAWIELLRHWQKAGSIDADFMFYPKGSHGHDRGPCLTAIGFRDPKMDRPTLTVYSRSSEFPHKFLADLWLLVGVADILTQLKITNRPILIRWFISLTWMDCRTANYLRVMRVPIHPPYTNIEKFNFRVEEQWENYIISDKEVSFSTLKNLKRLYKQDKKVSTSKPSVLARIMGFQPETLRIEFGQEERGKEDEN